jgi:hypothetical protein
MSAHERFERMARLARRDAPGPIDVSHAVRARLAGAARPRPETVDRTLLGFALGSSAAAVLVLALVAALDPALGDPLAELLQSLSVVMR